jgi:mannose-6-phosphate isomerase-like protein (cupin superfamily)
VARTANIPPNLARDTASSWFSEQVASACGAAPGERHIAAVERVVKEGMMPPLHRRDQDEAYRLLEGRVTFFIGDVTVRAEAGDVVVAPSAAARTFRVESAIARWVVLTRLSSLDRFQDFARAVSQPCEAWRSGDEERAVAYLASANGIELLGPPGALPSRS